MSVCFCFVCFLVVFIFCFVFLFHFANVGAFYAAGSKPMSYDEVFGQSSSTNCTVYCGNLAQGSTEEALQKIFGPYGQIQEIRVFKDKGYAFIRWGDSVSLSSIIVCSSSSFSFVHLCFVCRVLLPCRVSDLRRKSQPRKPSSRSTTQT